MPKFVIERELPGAGFPANRMSRISAMIDPTTSE
jgi:hypothetical protein